MNCPSCGAALRLEDGKPHLTCDFCRRLEFPQGNGDGVSLLDGPTDHQCPVCAVPLAPAAVRNHRIESCPRCRGLLLEMDLFVHIVRELRSASTGEAPVPPPARPGEIEREVRCPHCHELMSTHYYGGPGNIVIDSCSLCSRIWLDHGELRRVWSAPDSRPRPTFEPGWSIPPCVGAASLPDNPPALELLDFLFGD